MDTYYGHVRTPADAIKLFEACRLGLLPRVQRRLSDKERKSIKSGSVFVWDEREAGMRRWTDGKSWSASRVSGSFLTYREMEGKRGGGQFAPAPRRAAGKTPDSGRGSDEDMEEEGPDGYKYKPDGLMKQSFSITTSTGQHLHLISYYSRPHPNAPDLPQPTSDPQLRHIVPLKGMYPESTVHEVQGPAVIRTSMEQSHYMQSPQQQQQPLPSSSSSSSSSSSLSLPPNAGDSSPHNHRAPLPPPLPPYSCQPQTSPNCLWPPSPASTPPFPSYTGSMYNSSPLQALHPGSNHTPPRQHPSPQHHSQLPPTSSPQPMTAFDRPPPPLPMKQHTHHSLSMASIAPSPKTLPIHTPNLSPHVAQARLIAEQAQITSRALHNSSPSSAVHSNTHTPTSVLDPRLSATLASITSIPPPLQSHATSLQRISTPPLSGRLERPSSAHSMPMAFGTATPPRSHGAASSIPSISSLMHAMDSPSRTAHLHRAEPVESGSPSLPAWAGRDRNREWHGDSSREWSQDRDREQDARNKVMAGGGGGDIPHEKLNFLGEDQRAIRVLDRKFCV